MNKLKTSLIVLFFPAVVASLGCGSKTLTHSLMQEKNKQNIQKVANTYTLFFAMNPKRKGPSSKEELVNYIQNEKTISRNLNFMGIDRESYESYFTSENDGEEFVVRWNQRVPTDGGGIPIVFENTGIDGVRQVALSNSIIVDAKDDEKYQELMSGKISESEAGEKEQRLMPTE